jgi:hypothetical protein
MMNIESNETYQKSIMQMKFDVSKLLALTFENKSDDE